MTRLPLPNLADIHRALAYLPDAALCVGLNGAITCTNEAAQSLLGYTTDELTQLPVTAFLRDCRYPTADAPFTHFSILDLLATHAPSCEASVRRKDGSTRTVWLATKRLVVSGESQPQVVVTLKDITSYKHAETRTADEKHRFETLFNSINDAVFLAPITQEGIHGNFVEVNNAACIRLGYSRSELLSMNARSINPPANLDRVRSFGRHIRRESSTAFEAIHVTKAGAHIPVEVVAQVINLGDQQYVLSVVRDLSQQKQLERSASRFGRLMEHSWDEIYVFSSETLRILQVNQGALDNLGYSTHEMQQLTAVDIKPGMSTDQFRTLTRPLFDGTQSRIIFEAIHQRRDGTQYPVEVRLQLSHSEVPPVFLANVQDITQRKQTEQRLTYLANYDALTALPNRSLFFDRLRMAMETSLRTDTLLAVIFLDLDGFKAVNDTYGHEVGDFLIKSVAQRLSGCVRNSDTVARLGGDEFTIIATNLRHTGALETLLEKIVTTIAAPFYLGAHRVSTSTSMGITFYPMHEHDDTYTLLKQADTAMYQAKKTGKGRYHFYTAALAQKELRRSQLESALNGALAAGQLHLHYQPRVDLQSGEVVGAEALLRWTHPGLGNISPMEFIPIMESTGLIREVGQWVLFEACRQARLWHDAGHMLRIAINVSARQFDTGHFARQLNSTIDATGIAPRHIEIEITEGILISQTEETSTILHELKEIGVLISLDDFGSGYSSLNYIKTFPIDILKIDRAFVTDLGDNSDSTAIVHAILGLAKTLTLSVTAEGIERREQAEYLKAHGCHEGQGYYFAKPMPPQQLTEFLHGRRQR